ncbi:MAG: type II secretion system protein GspK [Phycisphaerae bacterium]
MTQNARAGWTVDPGSGNNRPAAIPAPCSLHPVRLRSVERRAVILPVVLMVLLLLGLLCAIFAFRVNADLSSTRAISFRLQTRLAAEAGIERVKLLLRESKFDVDSWYNNPDELHRIVVWVEDFDYTELGTYEEYDGGVMAYRFSIVADDPTDDEERIRIGITDEAAKLNLNTATEHQLQILVRVAVGEDTEEINPQDIVDAILDWRDKDGNPRREDAGTEGDYYRRLPQPYRVKNGDFDTVEELLLVKGVTGQILYGEDFDRNGLLTPNEDGVLNRGLYPYLTVLSQESNVSNNNRERAYLYGEEAKLRAELELAFPEDPDVVEFVVSATRKKGDGSNGSDNTGKRDQNPGPSGNKADKSNQKSGAGEDDPRGGVDEEDEGNESPETASPGGLESDDGKGTSAPMPSVASLLKDQLVGETMQPSPVTIEHLPTLLDRTSTVPPDQKTIPGLININTAPRRVLRCIDGLSPEQIDAIIEVRERLGPVDKETTAWLLMEEVVDLDTFERIAPQVTARGQQFTIESLGYADHLGMVTRLQVVVDAVGPIVQTLYYRDLTYLGSRFPIREEDMERIRVR